MKTLLALLALGTLPSLARAQGPLDYKCAAGVLGGKMLDIELLSSDGETPLFTNDGIEYSLELSNATGPIYMIKARRQGTGHGVFVISGPAAGGFVYFDQEHQLQILCNPSK